jgi:hypothetical protein
MIEAKSDILDAGAIGHGDSLSFRSVYGGEGEGASSIYVNVNF